MRARDYDLGFRNKARRTRAWGTGLLAAAALLWGWCAVLLLTPYEVDRKPDDKYPVACEPRLLTELGTAHEGRRTATWCASERDWPEALAVLGLSVPVSIAGVALFTLGTLSCRMSAPAEVMRERDKYPAASDA
ncbi:hypothetical protein [Streptomyces griseus]|uniref:hypothetical protein n=1 Tax=Streptomyces griseus TaxID=1911 RepID=UPI0004CB85BD|nr:hypothetical protein [Streptomyces griseus]